MIGNGFCNVWFVESVVSIQGFIALMELGKYKEAVRLFKKDHPFPATCGRICTHRCEEVCPVGDQGDPIAIRWLKRYATDAFTPEQIRDIVVEINKQGTGVLLVEQNAMMALSIADHGFIHSIYFRDPAGNSVEMAEPRLWAP